jgi:hypothetical protein
VPGARDALQFVGKYGGGGLFSYVFPRLLIRAGVPIDRWIATAGDWIHLGVSFEAAAWIASAVVGFALFGLSVWLSRPAALPSRKLVPKPATVIAASKLRVAQSPPSIAPTTPEPSRRRSDRDRDTLDKALYEAFETLTMLGAPLKRRIEERFVHNWETQYLNHEKGLTLEGLRELGVDARHLFGKLHEMTYSQYAYFRDDLREALAEGEGHRILAALDDYVKIVAAMPEGPTIENLRLLLGRDQEALEKAVTAFGKWLGESLERTRHRREALA